MNLMYMVLTSNFTTKDKNLNDKIVKLREKVKKSGIKISDKFTKLGDNHYYENCLPSISDARDVLKKPEGIVSMRVNWKKKSYSGLSTSEVYDQLKPQWGWNVSVVDAEHSRNKYKNKTNAWVVFDSEETARKAMTLFNSLFMTAIEQDAIEEYKRFKENPEKRPLSFDKLVSNAYELYEAVDKGEL